MGYRRSCEAGAMLFHYSLWFGAVWTLDSPLSHVLEPITIRTLSHALEPITIRGYPSTRSFIQNVYWSTACARSYRSIPIDRSIPQHHGYIHSTQLALSLSLFAPKVQRMKLLFSSSNTADGFLGDYRLTLYSNTSLRSALRQSTIVSRYMIILRLSAQLFKYCWWFFRRLSSHVIW